VENIQQHPFGIAYGYMYPRQHFGNFCFRYVFWAVFPYQRPAGFTRILIGEVTCEIE
jgi:hypothetical protein